MRSKYSALTFGLGLAALAALALPTPAEACFFIIGSAPNASASSTTNNVVMPNFPNCVSPFFNTMSAAAAFAAFLNGGSNSPSSNINNSFSTSADAFNFGNAGPGAVPDFSDRDLINAARQSGDVDYHNPQGYNSFFPDDSSNTFDGASEPVRTEPGANRAGFNEAICPGGQCDVGGFLDDLSGQSCTGGSCDVGDVFDFQAAVNVSDTGRISGFTLIEGGCDAGECDGSDPIGNWPNVMVQVLDLNGGGNSGGALIDPMHIQGSGGPIPAGFPIDFNDTGSNALDLGDDFFANPPPPATGSGATAPTGVRMPAINSYESITGALDAAWTSSAPSFVTVSNADGTRGQLTGAAPGSSNISAAYGSISDTIPVTVANGVIQNITVLPLTVENSTVSGNTTGGGSFLNAGVVPNPGGGSVVANIPNSTVSGNTAGGGGGITSGGPVSIPNSTVSGNTAGGGSSAELTTDDNFPKPAGGQNMTGGNTNVPEVQLTEAQFQGVLNGTLKITKSGAIVPR